MMGLLLVTVAAAVPSRLAAAQTNAAGGKIAFKAIKDLTDSLYVMSPDSSDVRLVYSVSEDQGWIYQIQWSPDYRYLTFLVEQAENKVQILVADVTGSQVYSFKDIFPLPLKWSPDGKHVAFYRGLDLSKDDPNRGFFVADPDGSHARLISNLTLSDYEWSPDGKSLSFVSLGDIYTVNTDGDPKPTRLLINPAPPTQVRWSPDSKYLGYKLYGDLFTVEISSQKRSPSVSGYRDKPFEWQPLSWSLYAWSPDGSWVALYRPAADRPTVPAVSTTAVYLMAPDGSKTVQLSENCAGTRAYWSPDSKSLACSPAAGSIVRIDAGDGKSHPVVSEGPIPDGAHGVKWSPDGSHLAYISKNTICLVEPDGANLSCADSTASVGMIQELVWQQDSRPVAIY